MGIGEAMALGSAATWAVGVILARQLGVQGGGVQAGLERQGVQRTLGGVALQAPGAAGVLLQLGVVAQRGGSRQPRAETASPSVRRPDCASASPH